MVRVGVLALVLALQDPISEEIVNPYYRKCEWKLWAVDPTPVADAQVAVPPNTKERATISPVPADKRLYPVEGKFLVFDATPSKKFAGTGDDVYASWSGDHGWVRDRWAGPGGFEIKGIRNSIVQFIDNAKFASHPKLGINFYHQSTTGMGHTLANAVHLRQTEQIEKIYFASGLVTAPAHISYTEEGENFLDRTNDLYQALMPTLLNSVGSSDSETMAITKLIAVGAHLDPDLKLKLKLKRHGLYASTMLYLWKAGLPLDVPYDSELRHRIAYAAVGKRSEFPGGYGAAGINRGDMALLVHEYDDVEHMRRMVQMAQSMKAPPPEAVLKVLEGPTKYALKKTALVIQEKGVDVELRVSAEDSYDIDGRPLTFRWKLLYGNKRTTVEREGESNVWRIRVPWDESLPEGRTTLLLIAHNGVSDGNPAAINVWRHKTASMPGTGAGYNDYQYDASQANRRPVIVGLQNAAAKPGETIRIPIRAVDPEGFPVVLAKRADEPGHFEGSEFVCQVPKKQGDMIVTVIASDGTSGNSYDAQQFRISVAPRIFARIKADRVAGPAPLKVKFTSDGSIDAQSFEWAFGPRAPGYPQMPKSESNGPSIEKTFDKPGVYQAWLKVKGPAGQDTALMTLFVGEPASGRSGIVLEGNGVELRGSAGEFDHSDFGSAREREFRLVNHGSEAVKIGEIKMSNSEFRLLDECKSIAGFGSARMRIRFTPQGPGVRTAELEIAGGKYALAGRGISAAPEPPKAEPAPDKEAAKLWTMAMNYRNNDMPEQAEKYLRQIIEKFPDSEYARKAREILKK